MNDHIKNTYLKQSYEDNWETYQQSLERATNLPKWDFFVITASNERQAQAYRIQIKERLKKGYLSSETKYIVISDPDGKRVGSGGATLNALYEVVEKCGLDPDSPFRGKRMIMIHSGGDSKRIPQYSAFGKLFSRVPRTLPDGRYSTLFDEFVIALSGVPTRMSEGILVASGDVLLLCNTNQMDLAREGMLGIAIKVDAKLGTKHGIYKLDESGEVSKFLHKLPLCRLQVEGAINEFGLVNIDTGLIWMDAQVAGKMLGLILTDSKLDKDKYKAFINEKIRLNFYGDFVIPFTKESCIENYLLEAAEGIYCDELLEVRKIIWETFHGIGMAVQPLSPAQFIHFGTSSELRELMGSVIQCYSFIGWSNKVMAVDDRANKKIDISLVNSYLGKAVKIGEDTFVEDSRLEGSIDIGKGCIISNVIDQEGFVLKENLVLHSLPVQDEQGRVGYITRVYGVKDNPKQSKEEGTFLGKPLSEVVRQVGIEIETLWDAQLYPICYSQRESIEKAIWLSNIDVAKEEEIKAWRELKRYSLKESYELADLQQILVNQHKVEDYIRVQAFLEKARNKKWIEETYLLLGNELEDITRRVNIALEVCKQNPISLERARLYRYIAEVCKKNNLSWRGIENRTYEDIAQLIEESVIGMVEKTILDTSSYAEKDGLKQVIVEMPARVNFGGGWSDTPPYNIENGGTVINAAITLKGKLPIKVRATFIQEPIIRLISHDLGIRKNYSSLKELLRYNDPTDPLALHKAAMVVTGILPFKKEEGRKELEEILKEIGQGIELYTEVDIPKGSGLGSSSILAGAVVKALNELLELAYDDNKLFEQVLCVEQLLTTGGGWQDQVGGLVAGIKLICSQKGLPQHLEVTKLRLSKEIIEELNERLVLIYTGQRRLAKGILREIMGEYILSHPQKIEILNEIQKSAIMMKYELEKGNLENFCQLLNEHFEMSKKLDKGITNNYIEAIIEVCKPYTAGMMICGAGGGGFLQLVLQDKNQKEELRYLLEQIFGDNHVELWDMEIYF